MSSRSSLMATRTVRRSWRGTMAVLELLAPMLVPALEAIPMLLAGSASGRIKTGFHIAGEGGPVTRVGLTVQQAMGLSVEGWGKASMETKKPITEILA